MLSMLLLFLFFFFFNDTATTEIYTLSLHDALPIYVDAPPPPRPLLVDGLGELGQDVHRARVVNRVDRSEEHTSELQSPCNLVCRLLLEKKKKKNKHQLKIIAPRLTLLESHTSDHDF